jgi:glycosyltransferase involved in cell wall biosynthesis
MRFSILTATLNQPWWLACCARSVADQEGVEIEHIIQDGGTEGIEGCAARIAAWTGAQLATPVGNELFRAEKHGYTLRLFSAPDSGMYDALNHAMDRATGDVVAILNSDEQYLPGALAAVATHFKKNPGADIAAGDCLIVDEKGALLSFRKSTPLRPAMILTDHLYDLTCAMFVRGKWRDRRHLFDPMLKDVADGEWVCKILQAGARPTCLRSYLAAFTWTGVNRSTQEQAQREIAAARRQLPLWMRCAAPFLRNYRHIEKLAAGGYRSGPLDYALYARPTDPARTPFRCERPRQRHPGFR